MSAPAREKRERSIHGTLVLRLVAAAFAISSVLTTLVAFIEIRNTNAGVAEQAANATERLRWAIMDNLDSPGLGDHARLQSIIDRAMSGRLRTAEGSIVAVRILDPGFRVVAGRVDRSYGHAREVTDVVLKDQDRAMLMRLGTWIRPFRVNGAVLIHMGHELRNTADRRAGFIEGVYAISPDFLRKARISAVLSGLVASSIVLLTTVILYPVIIRLLKRVSGLSADLLHANMEVLSVLGSAVAKRDNDTDIHNYRVTIYAVRIARELHADDDEIRTLIKGAFLHDVGKIGVSDAILLKPSSLTREEFEEMKKHVRHGLDIVGRSEWLRDAALVVGNHHEKYDGTGYLAGANGEEIPRVARMFAIADVFDALISKRPYKEPFPYDRAMEILEEGRGSHFDPEILDAFVRIAPELYESFANREAGGLEAELRTMGEQYFDRSHIDRIVSAKP